MAERVTRVLEVYPDPLETPPWDDKVRLGTRVLEDPREIQVWTDYQDCPEEMEVKVKFV